MTIDGFVGYRTILASDLKDFENFRHLGRSEQLSARGEDGKLWARYTTGNDEPFGVEHQVAPHEIVQVLNGPR